mgnify:CR=1 FL=1
MEDVVDLVQRVGLDEGGERDPAVEALGKTLTAPVLIFQLASQFQPNQAAAVATLLFAISFVLVLVTERLVGARNKDAV